MVEDVSAAAGTELFGALRDEVWQVAAVWLVTTSTAQLPGLLRPPADVFFETRVQLGPLDEAQAAELLYRRMDEPLPPDQTALVAAVSGSAPQTPRRLLDLARELAAAPAVGAGRLTMASGLGQRSAAVQRLSRPGRMLAQELDAVGWAAASDRTLLARLGWTRPRVVQVMAELENGGLVEMREENTGRGRPRKLYRLKPPRDFAPPIVAPDEPDRPADGDGSGPRVAGAGGRGGPEPGAAGSAGSAGPTGGADLQTGAEPR